MNRYLNIYKYCRVLLHLLERNSLIHDFDTLGNKIPKRVENLILSIFAGFICLFVLLPIWNKIIFISTKKSFVYLYHLDLDAPAHHWKMKNNPQKHRRVKVQIKIIRKSNFRLPFQSGFDLSAASLLQIIFAKCTAVCGVTYISIV